MSRYHKIQTVFKRNPDTNYRTLLEGEYSLPEFEYLANNKWVFTEKVDGTNIRVYFQDGKVYYKGRNDKTEIPAKLVERLNERFLSQLDKFVSVFSNAKVCLYGEGYGAKIQRAGDNYRYGQDFVLFDVKVNDWWLQRSDVEDIAYKFSLDVVPIVGKGTLHDMVKMVKEGITSYWGSFRAEGIVARPAVELKTRAGERIITKVKCRDFPS